MDFYQDAPTAILDLIMLYKEDLDKVSYLTEVSDSIQELVITKAYRHAHDNSTFSAIENEVEDSFFGWISDATEEYPFDYEKLIQEYGVWKAIDEFHQYFCTEARLDFSETGYVDTRKRIAIFTVRENLTFDTGDIVNALTKKMHKCQDCQYYNISPNAYGYCAECYDDHFDVCVECTKITRICLGKQCNSCSEVWCRDCFVPQKCKDCDKPKSLCCAKCHPFCYPCARVKKDIPKKYWVFVVNDAFKYDDITHLKRIIHEIKLSSLHLKAKIEKKGKIASLIDDVLYRRKLHAKYLKLRQLKIKLLKQFETVSQELDELVLELESKSISVDQTVAHYEY